MKTSYKNESEFESDFCRYLKGAGFITLKMDGVQKGFPDRLVISPIGDVFFFEFKNPNGRGRLSPAQEHWLDVLDEMGQMVAVIETIDDANDILFRLMGAEYANAKMGTTPVPEGSPELREDVEEWTVISTRAREDIDNFIVHQTDNLGDSTEGVTESNMDGGEPEVEFRPHNGSSDWDGC